MPSIVDHPKAKPFALAIGLGLVVAVFVLCLMPLQVKTVENGDKVQHLLAYATLMGWFGFWFPSRLRVWLLLFIAMGVLIEFLQAMTPYRSFSVADMLANSLGAGLAFGMLIFLRIKQSAN